MRTKNFLYKPRGKNEASINNSSNFWMRIEVEVSEFVYPVDEEVLLTGS